MDLSGSYPELIEKSYGEVLADKKLRKELVVCLHEIFGIDGLRISFDDSNNICCLFEEQFFFKKDFFYGGKPSDKRIQRFFQILKGLQIREEYRGDFVIDLLCKPSSTNLRMKLKFPLRKLIRKQHKKTLDEIKVKDVIIHLQELLDDLKYTLRDYYRYNVF